METLAIDKQLLRSHDAGSSFAEISASNKIQHRSRDPKRNTESNNHYEIQHEIKVFLE